MNCKRCGNEMDLKLYRSDAKYCGNPCTWRIYDNEQRRKLTPRNCKICSKSFQPVSPINVYCSKECQKVNGKKLYDEWLQSKREKRLGKVMAKPKKVCAYRHCNKEFLDTQSNKRFCSKECRLGHERVLSNDQWLNREQVHCGCCSKLFTQKSSRQIYCSKACHKKVKNYLAREEYRKNPNRPCSRCNQRVLSKNSKAKICDRCSKDLQKIKMNKKMFNAPESDIVFEPESNDFFNSPWTRLQQRHYIDLEPTDSSVEDSEFRNEIQNYLKKGGKITKLSVGFCSSPINMELT